MRRTTARGLAALIAATIAGVAVPTADALVAQPKGRDGCADMYADSGCARGNGTQSAVAVVWSPDSRFAYVASGAEDYGAVTIFRRGTGGRLRQLSGLAGCLSGDGRNGQKNLSRKHRIGVSGRCRDVRGLHSTDALALSPDGRFLVAASDAFGGKRATLTVFARDAQRGTLTQLAGAAGCLSRGTGDGCTASVPQLDGAHAMALSGDGRTLAVAMDAGVLLLAFDPATGAIAPLPGACLFHSSYAALPAGCADVPAVEDASDVLLTPDGSTLVVGGGRNFDSGVVSALRRNGAGAWAVTGCVRSAAVSDRAECAALAGLSGWRTGVLNADGSRLYVSSAGVEDQGEGEPDVFHSSALLALAVGPGGTLDPTASGACVAAVGEVPAGCTPGRGFTIGYGLALARGGLYAAWSGYGSSRTRARDAAAVEAWGIDPASGGLVRRTSRDDCVSVRKVGGCARSVRAVNGYMQIAAAPNGRALAVTSNYGTVAGLTTG